MSNVAPVTTVFTTDHEDADSGAGAGANSGGQPVNGAGRRGQARQVVQSGAGDTGDVDAAKHRPARGRADLT